MKIAIIGASGHVGSRLLAEALNRGHRVTAIVRHPEKVAIQHDNLTVQKGDAQNQQELAQLLSGHQAVISAFNVAFDDPNVFETYKAAATSIVEAVKQAGVPRLLSVGGAGSLEVGPGVQLVDTPEFPAAWKPGALGTREILYRLRQEPDLDWTYLSPARLLQPGPRTGQFRRGTDQLLLNEQGESKISTEDFAVAMLDELEVPEHSRQRFTVGY